MPPLVLVAKKCAKLDHSIEELKAGQAALPNL